MYINQARIQRAPDHPEEELQKQPDLLASTAFPQQGEKQRDETA